MSADPVDVPALALGYPIARDLDLAIGDDVAGARLEAEASVDGDDTGRRNDSGIGGGLDAPGSSERSIPKTECKDLRRTQSSLAEVERRPAVGGAIDPIERTGLSDHEPVTDLARHVARVDLAGQAPPHDHDGSSRQDYVAGEATPSLARHSHKEGRDHDRGDKPVPDGVVAPIELLREVRDRGDGWGIWREVREDVGHPGEHAQHDRGRTDQHRAIDPARLHPDDQSGEYQRAQIDEVALAEEVGRSEHFGFRGEERFLGTDVDEERDHACGEDEPKGAQGAVTLRSPGQQGRGADDDGQNSHSNREGNEPQNDVAQEMQRMIQRGTPRWNIRCISYATSFW